MKLFDIHAHVLPGVDDGAATEAEALQMLRNAAACDVQALVVTPHCNVPGMPENYLTPQLTARFEALCRAATAAALPLRLLLGSEVRATAELPALLKAGLIPTLNGSRYVLTEFPHGGNGESYRAALRGILDAGFIPLVAHPERYSALCREPAMVHQWLDMGCHVQLTAGSILGKFGREVMHTAQFLLDRDLVACVASDAHGVNSRTNYLSDVYTHLQLHYNPDYAHALLWENPRRICRDEML